MMKFCGTDSATTKAASMEGAFLMQIENLNSSEVISTPHEAQSIFSVIPNHRPRLSAITWQRYLVWCLLGCLRSQVLHGNSTLLETFALVYGGK